MVKLQKEADKLLQKIGREKYSKCLICGNPMSCLHHFIPKSVSSNLRYNWDNLIPICQACHFGIHKKSNPLLVNRIIKIKGDKWLKKLEKEKDKIIKTNKNYYTDIINKLKL